jgi:hypothetical protein
MQVRTLSYRSKFSQEDSMKLKFALVGLAALGSLAAAGTASAMPAANRMLSAAPMELSSKSRAVMDMGMGGAITVEVIITVGAEAAATTMVGGIITIGGDLNLSPF